MAVTVEFINDETTREPLGNYSWTVYANHRALARGRIEGFDRQLGWEGLVIALGEQLACRPLGKTEQQAAFMIPAEVRRLGLMRG